MTIHGPADGWVEAPDGRKFWGRAGAAGLLVVDPDDRILLQHRAVWSHFGDTWGIPGGARQFDESAVEGALRESAEEAAVPRDALRILFTSVVDLGFWSYTTVVARAITPFEPVISDSESEALGWVPLDVVDELPLHPGFASSLVRLRGLLHEPLHLVVDSANVVGSRPDGWWRDRAGATDRLLDGLEGVARDGVPAIALGESGDGAVAVWWPFVTVVVEGQAKTVEDRDPSSPVSILRAETDGDSAVVAHVADIAGSARVVVVTADRQLSARVEDLGARVVGPASLLGVLP